jgi:hypothetical protein
MRPAKHSGYPAPRVLKRSTRGASFSMGRRWICPFEHAINQRRARGWQHRRGRRVIEIEPFCQANRLL